MNVKALTKQYNKITKQITRLHKLITSDDFNNTHLSERHIYLDMHKNLIACQYNLYILIEVKQQYAMN